MGKDENRRPSLDSCGPPRDDQDGAEVSAKDPGKVPKTKQKVTFALQKNTVRNRPNDEGTLYYMVDVWFEIFLKMVFKFF